MLENKPSGGDVRRRPAHVLIANELRSELRAGKFPLGSQFPTTQELTGRWGSSYFTLHTALRTLVKEGWLERRVGAGTYVTDPFRRFFCAGIYHGREIGVKNETFGRNVHFSLLEQFSRAGKSIRTFVDSRPGAEQMTLFEPLREALEQREIQCVVGLAASQTHRIELAKLPIPTSFFTGEGMRNEVRIDDAGAMAQAARELKGQGCKTIGLISTLSGKRNPAHQHFFEVLKTEGLVTRAEWLGIPSRPIIERAPFGHEQFHALWRQRRKPEGLVVWNDDAVRGAILAIMELGVRPPKNLRVVLHRNAGSPLICPFPASWAVLDEHDVAQALIRLVDAQFEGQRPKPLTVSLSFNFDPALAWK